jgi:sugar/nucleoside kinase (ribokinase family)
VYPGANPDERKIYVDSSAGAFQVEQVENLDTRIAVVGASFRGEVTAEILQILESRKIDIALDVQGFVRSVHDRMLVAEPWAERAEILSLVSFLKADIAEAELLTGTRDLRDAARILFDLGSREILLTHRDGVLVFDGRDYHEAGFYPREVVGRSGRGDTCIAAYSCKRLDSQPAEATVWAAAITSLKMETDGPFNASIEQVEDLIERRYR